VIYGDRLRFRAIEREDLPAFVKWLNNPEVRAGLSLYLPGSMMDEEEWFEGMRKHPPDEHNLAIEIRQPPDKLGEPTWKMIGGTGFVNLDSRNRSAEFGIVIGDKSCWDQGYGTEAVRLLVKHGFNTLNLNRIYLRVLENNPRAIRAYEKASFSHEGRQRRAEYKDGKYLDLLVMSILKDEFVNG
jgi:diamine N-acetyltransferase